MYYLLKKKINEIKCKFINNFFFEFIIKFSGLEDLRICKLWFWFIFGVLKKRFEKILKNYVFLILVFYLKIIL